jgi:hypothetical protein
MHLLLKPRFIALDSSHLGDIARNRASLDDKQRRIAQDFQRAFDASNNVLLLSWHHIQELLSHRDESVVAERIAYLKSLPFIASVRSARDDDVIGGIIDILTFEVQAAFNAPTIGAAEIREVVAPGLLHVGSGAEIIRSFLEVWPIMKSELVQRQERDREIVAISRSGFAQISHVKVVELLRGKVRPSDEIQQRFRVMHEALSRDIKQRGDQRLSDAEAVSASFLESVRRFGMETLTHENPGRQILEANGIDLSDIDENTTVGEVGTLAVFRGKLRVINRMTRLPWEKLTAIVSAKRLPSQIIQSSVDRFRPDGKEWKGSDLNDAHLGSLAAYADVTYVDKRTHEAMRIARGKIPEFAALVRRVEKAGHYSNIPTQIAAISA